MKIRPDDPASDGYFTIRTHIQIKTIDIDLGRNGCQTRNINSKITGCAN